MENFLNRYYQELVSCASVYSDTPNDLVHHTYIKLVEANFTYVSDMTALTYFKRAMYNNHRGDFKKLYAPCELLDSVPDFDNLEERLNIEALDEVVRHLDFFDRTIFEMYLRGDNMAQVARESGISYGTITDTIYRIKNTIREVL